MSKKNAKPKKPAEDDSNVAVLEPEEGSEYDAGADVSATILERMPEGMTPVFVPAGSSNVISPASIESVVADAPQNEPLANEVMVAMPLQSSVGYEGSRHIGPMTPSSARFLRDLTNGLSASDDPQHLLPDGRKVRNVIGALEWLAAKAGY